MSALRECRIVVCPLPEATTGSLSGVGVDSEPESGVKMGSWIKTSGVPVFPVKMGSGVLLGGPPRDSGVLGDPLRRSSGLLGGAVSPFPGLSRGSEVPGVLAWPAGLLLLTLMTKSRGRWLRTVNRGEKVI